MKIKSQTFRLSALALMVSVAASGMSANAVYNLYKKDGLTFDINGQADMQFTKNDAKHELLVDADHIYRLSSGNLQYTSLKAGEELAATDKRTRLGQDHGVSYIDIRGAQVLPGDWRITGNFGIGYSSSKNLYLSNSSVSFDKKDIGAISLGRQYLHTGYVNRTGTDTPLDIFSSSAVRLDYYGLPGLHASAYYSLAGSNDVRKEANNAIKSGYGVSASYKLPLSENSSIRLAAGYTQNRANPVTTNITTYSGVNALNSTPEKARGMAASAELQAGDFLIALDAGRKNEDMSTSTKTPLDSVQTNYLGAKVAYDINPVFRISAGYGVKKAEKTLKESATPLFTTVDNYQDAKTDKALSYVTPAEKDLFHKIDTKEMYAQIDYRIRPNVRLYTRFDNEVITNKLNDQDFSKLTDKNYRAGVVFTF